MSLEDRLDIIAKGWRGPLVAALLALLAGLPGAFGLPPLDRDESRFAQASAQMLETGDFVSIRFQDTPRYKKPVGIYWLQAASVKLFEQLESRRIWAWRVPSLLGVALAAAACAWAGAGFLGSGGGLLAGVLLATGVLIGAEADIAATDAALTGAIALAMGALARLYLAARGGPPAGWRSKALFWLGLAAGVLLKGPIAPMIVALTLLSLCLWERRCAWLRDIGWGWGSLLLLATVGPWAMAITVASDGAFWGAAVGKDLAPKLLGGQEGHGAPPLLYAVLAPLTLFPATLLLPAGCLAGWRARAEPGVRFALCWLLPSWLLFELIPTKLIHYPLPLYPALAWLMAGAAAAPVGRVARWLGVGLAILAAAIFAAIGPLAMDRLDDWTGAGWAGLAAVLFLLSGAGGSWLLLRGRAALAVIAAGALAVAAHGVLAGVFAPSLRPLWLSSRAARALADANLSPRQGVVPGPVTVAGYEEPSLVFLLGSDTELGDAAAAAAAIADGRPAIVERRLDGAFRKALAAEGARALRVGQGAGLDYSNNRHDILFIYRPPPGGP